MEPHNYVLIVDDNPDALVLFTVFVESLGLEAHAVDNGMEALRVARTTPPALIILDVMMPGMSGYDVLRHVQFNPDTRDTPIVIVSAGQVERRNLPDLAGTVVEIVRKGGLDYPALAVTIRQAVKPVKAAARAEHPVRGVAPPPTA